MADEQPPPKRDVNELFTLDASDPTSDADGPLAHLLSASPVADPGRPLDAPAVDNLSNPSEVGLPGLPGLADVSGLEDLYVTTTEVPLGTPPAEPLPPAFAPGRTEPEDHRPVDPWMVEPVPVDLTPAKPRPTGSRPTRPRPRPEEPVPVQPEPPAADDPFRSFEVGGNLRFSTEAGARSAGVWPATGPQDRAYPAALVPNAVPAPVAPNKSVRVPGEERR
ncbi:MAG: hypothetical protein OEZ14_01155, partial [Acidimicrobiia bacterium]|nr:hypothetical protein [Acidimicrobiia bacterium]